jgi:hypothetical protein
MTISGYKRLTIALASACFALLMLSGSLIWRHEYLKIRISLASEQTKIFNEMRIQALKSAPEDAANSLEYLMRYYPSGSKQEKGSRLDIMVEHERQLAARDIMAYLRNKTNEDLGDNPQTWIQKYGKR